MVFEMAYTRVTAPALHGRDDAGAETIRRADWLMAAALGCVGLALYAVLGLRLARGQYFDYYNLAFDFDPARYVSTLALAGPDPGNFKHPLILLLRPLAWPFLAAGLDPKQASVMVMAGFGGATVAVCFLFLRVIRAGLPEAAALTVLFAVTGTPIFTSIIVEAYGPAGFGLAALWLVTARRLDDGKSRTWQRYAIAVFSFGVTLTNVMQVFVAELLVSLRVAGPIEAVRRAIVFGLILTGMLAVLGAFVWHDALLAALTDPVLAMKEIYWLRTKGFRVGAFEVVRTFVAYSFVSPGYDTLHLPEGIEMRDFRGWHFTALGLAAVWCWLLFLASGAAGALAHPRTRWLATGMAAALALNIVFHLDFQFRGSVYLYASHMHFLVFGLACGLAPWVREMRAARWAYVGAVLGLAVLVGGANLPAAAEFTRAFDKVDINCPAPCTEAPQQNDFRSD
jgi:hypothetical protein